MAKRKRKRKNIEITLMVIMLYALVVGYSTSLAFITRESSITNNFVIGTITPSIEEDFTNNIKRNVYISNVGNSPSYVRVAILYSFTDLDGKVLFDPPVVNTDYAVSFSNSSNWLSSTDGYYYYKYILDENDSTDILINEIRTLRTFADKKFNADILVESVQVSPDSAVREAWNVNVNNGILSLRN